MGVFIEKQTQNQKKIQYPGEWVPEGRAELCFPALSWFLALLWRTQLLPAHSALQPAA